MTREEYEKIVRDGAEEIEAVKNRIVDAYSRRLDTVEGVESPEVDGVDEDVIDGCWEEMDIGYRVTRYVAEMRAEGLRDVRWDEVRRTF
jgi:hypothetical protein